jgi:hypothetical protein
MGGLGNQMFQYACGVGVSERCGTPLHLNKDSFHGYHRKLLIDKFPIQAEFSSQINPVVEEQGFPYNKNIENVTSGMLRGYWQSEKYFEHCKDRIRKDFYLPSKPNNGVAVHVRRGDYLKLQHIHPVTPLYFYEEVGKRYKGKDFYIFSDDMEWCKENIKMPGEMCFVEGDEFKHLTVMGGCESHIIANSTFSWWGAWLSGSEDVTVPMPWFSNGLDTKDLIPKTWRSFQLTKQPKQ